MQAQQIEFKNTPNRMKAIDLHEHFETFMGLWDLYECCVDGMPAMLKYLHRHPAEKSDKYEFRKKLATWHGLPSEILLRWNVTFDKAIVHLELPALLQPVAENMGGDGRGVKAWRLDVFDALATYGCVWGLIDAPATNKVIETEAQRIAEGINPYCAVVTPPHVWNWKEDAMGNLVMVLYDTGEEYEVAGSAASKAKKAKLLRRYTLEDRAAFVRDVFVSENGLVLEESGNAVECTLYDADGKPRLPWFRVGLVKSRKYPGFYRSPLDGLAEKARQLFNIENQNQVLYYKAAFSFLVWPAGRKVKQLGQSSIVELEPNDMVPKYIEPDAVLFDKFADYIDSAIKEIFVLAGMKPTQTELVDNRKSGVAIAEERHDTRDKVTTIAHATEEFERGAWKRIAQYLKAPDAAVKLTYPIQYDTTSLQESLAELEQYAQRRNVELYLHRFAHFVRTKVSDPEDQERIIKNEQRAIGVRLQPLAQYAQLIDMLAKMGALSIADLVRTVNPALSTATDEEALEYARKNAETFKAASDEFGFAAALAARPAKEQKEQDTSQQENNTSAQYGNET